MNRRFFIVGAQRSGTTFTSLAIGSHPDCYVWVNGKVLYYLIIWIGRDPSLAASRHPRYDEIAHALQRMPVLGIAAKDREATCTRYATGEIGRDLDGLAGPRAIATLWDRTFAHLTAAPVRGEKYNECVFQIGEILAVFPKAHFLFIHRDPREVAASMLASFQTKPWCPPSIVDALLKWTHWNRAWLDARSSVPAEQRMEIGYREIIDSPRETFARVFSFAGVQPNDAMLDTIASRVHPSSTMPAASGRIASDSDFTFVCDALGYQP